MSVYVCIQKSMLNPLSFHDTLQFPVRLIYLIATKLLKSVRNENNRIFSNEGK